MACIGDSLPLRDRIALATLGRLPTEIAWHFGRHVGQFYDRAAYDTLARDAAAQFPPRERAIFRARLNRLLADRDERPVDWETPEAPGSPGAFR